MPGPPTGTRWVQPGALRGNTPMGSTAGELKRLASFLGVDFGYGFDVGPCPSFSRRDPASSPDTGSGHGPKLPGRKPRAGLKRSAAARSEVDDGEFQSAR